MKGLLSAGLLLAAAAAVAPGSSGYKVILTWSAPAPAADPVAGYNIYRAHVGFGYFEKLNSDPVTTTTYTDSTVQFRTKYVYYVKSVDAEGHESLASNTWSATIPSRAAWELRFYPILKILLFVVLPVALLITVGLIIRLRITEPN